ncbi:MAG TPA: amidohydrolase family protein [Dehalococcoidia bacterium]|nr:amidohydrolase family protein [Dehalococcoidia bacterium]
MGKHGVISADGHIDFQWLPGDLFVSEAPKEFKDRVPRLVDSDEGPIWQVQGRRIGAFPDVITGERYRPGMGVQIERMAATGLYSDGEKGLRRPTTPELRVQDQELDGIDGEVIYGILSLDRRMQPDNEAVQVCYQIYNTWVADFCKADPNRFKAVAPTLNDNPQNAANELRRVAKLGLAGIEIKLGQIPQPMYHKDWEVLWDAAEETGLIVHFHAGGANIRRPSTPEEEKEYNNVTQVLSRSVNKMANAEDLGAMILSGVLHRHPKMTLVMGEVDISWLPHFLWRMDSVVKERGEYDLGLPMPPSQYWYRQCRATFQKDPLGAEFIRHIGADNVMWGNDYPHPDGVWPESRKLNDQQFACLTPENRKKITHDNVAKLYGFKA